MNDGYGVVGGHTVVRMPVNGDLNRTGIKHRGTTEHQHVGTGFYLNYSGGIVQRLDEDWGVGIALGIIH